MLETGGSRSFIRKGRPADETRPKILESISIYENRNRVLGQDGYSPSKAELELKVAGFIGRSAALYDVLTSIKKYRDSDQVRPGFVSIMSTESVFSSRSEHRGRAMAMPALHRIDRTNSKFF
jgi:hypothetical protein